MNVRKKKVCLLIQFWKSTKGGLSTRFSMIVEELKKRNAYEIVIVTPDHYFSKEVINIKGKRNKFIMLICSFWALLKTSPDIIHCVEHGYMLLSAIFYKLLKKKCKVVFSIHTAVSPSKKKIKFFENLLLEWAINKCDGFFAVSNYLARNYIKSKNLKIKKSVRILPTGIKIVSIEKFKNEIEEFRKKYALENVYPVISTIGNLIFDWKIKGIELLIKSFKKLDLPNGKLIIAGDGRYKEYLENLVLKFHLKDKIIFTGRVENPYVVLAITDIYCHLALKEAFGIAILEAMSVGKPVVASNRGGIPEIIKDKVNGILVEPVVEEVVKGIRNVLENKQLREEISINAQREAEMKYNIKKIGEKYIQILESL